MQQSLKQWQGPKIYGAECPFCGSTKYMKYSLDNGNAVYRCQQCRRRFTERTQFECICQIPGKTVRCHECLGFQTFVGITQLHTDELRGLNLQQLQKLKECLKTSENPDH